MSKKKWLVTSTFLYSVEAETKEDAIEKVTNNEVDHYDTSIDAFESAEKKQ